MIFNRYLRFILAATASALATTGQADDTVDRWYSGSKISVGVAYHQTELDVAEPDAPITYGVLVDRGSVQPRLALTTPRNAFREGGRLGYYFDFGIDRFAMSRQRLGPDGSGGEADLGTSASGYLIHASPTLFWDAIRVNGHRLTLGFFIGWGYLKMDGDIVFTESPGQSTHQIDIDRGNFYDGFVVSYHYDHWFLGISGSDPSAKTAGYEYLIYDVKFEIGYEFTL